MLVQYGYTTEGYYQNYDVYNFETGILIKTGAAGYGPCQTDLFTINDATWSSWYSQYMSQTITYKAAAREYLLTGDYLRQHTIDFSTATPTSRAANEVSNIPAGSRCYRYYYIESA